MSAHTPGPWVWVDEYGAAALVAADGTIVADDGSASGEYARTIEPTSANARLIAAAPDLLDALQVLFDAHEMLFHPKDRIRKANKDANIEKARAAIAKATGAQP